MSLSPLQALILARSSVRRYEEREVSDVDILSTVDAARLAPSASNGQPWRFIIVKSTEAREALARACLSGVFSPTRFAARAPVIIALCAERGRALAAAQSLKDRAMYQLDCGIAGEHLVLRAAELGLGTCWIGWFNRRKARRALGAPAHVRVVSLIAMGYPAAGQAARKKVRRPLELFAFRDSWRTPWQAGAGGMPEEPQPGESAGDSSK